MKEEIVDLQIYITRSPGHRPIVYEGIPSFVIPGERHRDNSQSGSLHTTHQSQDTLPPPELSYVAIANSSAIEAVSIPFSPTQMRDMVYRLTTNQANLVEGVEFGTKLFNFAMKGSIRDLFRAIKSQAHIVRITIATSLPELAVLPWELICDTRSGSFPKFLCYQSDIRLCRSLQMFDRSNFQIQKKLGDNSLRILLVTANPLSEYYLDSATEERQLKFVLEQPPAVSEIVDFRALHDANVNSLRETLLSFKPHILHFSCHGGYDLKENLGYVLLCSPTDQNKADFVNSYRLASIIQESSSVQMAFISTCYGARGSDITAFSGVAQLLHASGIDAVIASDFSLMDTTGHSIVLNFYRYLLREKLSIEESISKVRKFLFINGYPLHESFGLSLYQANSSLYWPDAIPISEQPYEESKEFNQFIKRYEDFAIDSQQLDKRLADILHIEEISSSLSELKELTPVNLYLSVTVFGDLDIAVQLIRRLQSGNVPIEHFLKLAETSKIICHRPIEGKHISTAYILKPEINPNKYIAGQFTEISEVLELNMFTDSFSVIMNESKSVNGEDRAIATFFHKNKPKEYKSFVYNLHSVSDNDLGKLQVIGDSRWDKVSYLVHSDGCAFVLPGDSRVKLIIKGEQVAEYRHGAWKLTNLEELRVRIIEIAKKLSLDEKMMISLLKKCVYASETGRGVTFVLQRSDNVFERCHGTSKLLDENDDLRRMSITEFGQKEYLDRIQGDGATIISEGGHTLARTISLSPLPETHVEGIIGTGNRHLSAQKITKEIDAIAIVVSHDGPITVFQDGKVEVRIV